MTRKKLVIIIVCVAILLALCTAGGYYALSFIKHPAFTHDDYVYGNKLVIDNETPFEYDAELAVKTRTGIFVGEIRYSLRIVDVKSEI